MTKYSTDFAGASGALGAGDGVTQMHATKTLGRNGSGQAVQSAGDLGDVNVMVNGSFGARQFSRVTLGNSGVGADSINVLVHITSPGASFNGYEAFVDNTTPTLRNLEIWKYTAGVGARLGAVITIPAGSEPTTADDLYVEISADASPVIDVYRVRAGVFLLLGSRTDASSPFTSGNPGFGTFWDGTGTAPLLDAATAGDISVAAPLLGSLTLKSATGAPIMAVRIGNHLVPDSAVASNIVLTADVGSLVLTGFAPSLNLGVNASLGQLVLNGFAPSLNQKINAALGSLVLTGFAPTLDQKLNAALGALTITGFAPSLDQKINAALGQLVLTGFAPSLNTQLNAAVGQLVLNGFAASPVIGTNLIAQLGTLDLTGFAPTVNVTDNISILAGLGELLIDGFAPDITGQDTTQVAGTGPTGDRRMALMEELRELQQTLAQEKEPQHKGFRDDRVVKRRKEIEAALRLEQKREAARLAAEVAAENEDEEGLLNIILNFLGGSDVS